MESTARMDAIQLVTGFKPKPWRMKKPALSSRLFHHVQVKASLLYHQALG